MLTVLPVGSEEILAKEVELFSLVSLFKADDRDLASSSVILEGTESSNEGVGCRGCFSSSKSDR